MKKYADRDFGPSATARLRRAKLDHLLGDTGFRMLNLTGSDIAIRTRAYRLAFLRDVTQDLDVRALL